MDLYQNKGEPLNDFWIRSVTLVIILVKCPVNTSTLLDYVCFTSERGSCIKGCFDKT